VLYSRIQNIVICQTSIWLNEIRKYSYYEKKVWTGGGQRFYHYHHRHDITEILLKVALNTIKPTTITKTKHYMLNLSKQSHVFRGNVFVSWHGTFHMNLTQSNLPMRSPLLSSHLSLEFTLTCPGIYIFLWIEPLLRGHLSYKATFSLSQRSWPLNTGLTVSCYI
jgi:hypothetical protein